VLDIGAGTGRDAAALASMGHKVMAVEPLAAFRERAVALHPSARIEWVDDSLPDLTRIPGEPAFDLVMLTAVWMHLDVDQRRRGMTRVSCLLRAGSTLLLSLRHGPFPDGRRMFHVSPDETIELARGEGLVMGAAQTYQRDFFGRPGVTWTTLAFAKAG
jgi:SAM-dependent methyltransferase